MKRGSFLKALAGITAGAAVGSKLEVETPQERRRRAEPVASMGDENRYDNTRTMREQFASQKASSYHSPGFQRDVYVSHYGPVEMTEEYYGMTEQGLNDRLRWLYENGLELA